MSVRRALAPRPEQWGEGVTTRLSSLTGSCGLDSLPGGVGGSPPGVVVAVTEIALGRAWLNL